MKINRVLSLIGSILLVLLISLFPISNILLYIKEVKNIYLSFGVIFYLLILILVCLFVLFELIYYIRYVLKSDMKNKILWIILLILLNIFIFPFFNRKVVFDDKKVVVSTVFYVIALLFYVFIFIFGYNVYTDLNNIKLAEEKRIEEERNVYKTKDSKVSFTFRHGYEQKEVGEYDLYVINEDKPLVFSVFTYNTIDYAQKNATDYLNKGVEDIKKDKSKFVLIDDLKEEKKDGYTIYSVLYNAESEIKTSKKISTVLCYYRISVINFDSNPDYMIYTVEVIPNSIYETVKTEANEILESVKFN